MAEKRELVIHLDARDRTKGAFAGVRKNVASLGQQFTKLRGLMAGVFGVAVVAKAVGSTAQAFMSFEYQLNRMRATMRGGTEKEFEVLSLKAQQLGLTTQFTATQAMDAMVMFVKAGESAGSTLRGIDAALQLAAAGELDLSNAVEITTLAMKTWNLEQSELEGVVDSLVVAANSSKTSVAEMGEAFQLAAPDAADLGMSVEDTMATLAAFAEGNRKATEGGTALRQVLHGLSAPTKSAQDALEKLGIEVADADRNFLPLTDILDQFEEALEGLGTEAKADIIGKIFMKRSGTSFRILMNQGSDSIREFRKELGVAAKGASAKAMMELLGGTTGQMVLLKSAAKGLQITWGEVWKVVTERVLSGLRKVIIGIQGFVKLATPIFRAWSEFVGEVAKTMFDGFKAVFGGVGGALSKVFEFFGISFGDWWGNLLDGMLFILKNWKTIAVKIITSVALAQLKVAKTIVTWMRDKGQSLGTKAADLAHGLGQAWTGKGAANLESQTRGGRFLEVLQKFGSGTLFDNITSSGEGDETMLTKAIGHVEEILTTMNDTAGDKLSEAMKKPSSWKAAKEVLLELPLEPRDPKEDKLGSGGHPGFDEDPEGADRGADRGADTGGPPLIEGRFLTGQSFAARARREMELMTIAKELNKKVETMVVYVEKIADKEAPVIGMTSSPMRDPTTADMRKKGWRMQ